jgi:hypothetical protein
MKVALPDIPEHERTPLVLLLLDIIHQQHERIALLEDEIAALKGLKPRPKIQPSTLEIPKPTTPTPQTPKRPGSDKRHKNAQLTIHREIFLPLPQPPPGAGFKGYEDYVVQDLVLEARTTRYRRERWHTADGRTLVAPLPDVLRAKIVPGSHFGLTLHTFVLYQYHHQRVTRPLLLEGLRQWGIDISAGQVNNLRTVGRDAFHQEKEELLPAGLLASRYVGVDDTGASSGADGLLHPHRHDLFAFFCSTEHKSRLNFLATCGSRTPTTWSRRGPGLLDATEVAADARRCLGDQRGHLPGSGVWQTHLTAQGVTGERRQDRHRRRVAGA